MIDRHGDPSGALDRVIGKLDVDRGDADEIVEPAPASDGIPRELQNGAVADEQVQCRVVVADARHAPSSGLVRHLQ